MPSLLIVEDEPVLVKSLAKFFAAKGFDVRHASSVADGRRLAAETPPDVALLDFRLPDGSGLDVLDALVADSPDLPVIMMTAYGSVTDAVRAMQRGARDYVQKPLDLSEVHLKIESGLRSARERREISYYRGRDAIAGGILGESAAIVRLRTLVERVSRLTGASGGAAPTVLLLGETGSGKGHVARAIHAAGGRRGGPFIEVNCTALPENLVEDELFGHERGAFTDAKTARVGLFETADGGAIFLDEIGHISPPLQSKFLKAIEEKVVRRLGASSDRRVDVQVIAATSRDLEDAVRLGEFREDLYQRLSVAVIRIPPVREREGDAVLLARVFLEESRRRYGAPPRTLSRAAEDAIARYPWPGNVREIANTMERVVLFSDADPLEAEDIGLRAEGVRGGHVGIAPSGQVTIDFPESGLAFEAVERALLVAALAKAGGNQTAAARLLSISRDALRYRVDKYGLTE